jgi:hypothetical protein
MDPTRTAAQRWEEPTVGEEPDFVTTAALTRELRGLRHAVKTQGEALDRLSVAVAQQTAALERLTASLDRKKNR